jgi:hypothetical protein
VVIRLYPFVIYDLPSNITIWEPCIAPSPPMIHANVVFRRSNIKFSVKG